MKYQEEEISEEQIMTLENFKLLYESRQPLLNYLTI